MSFCTNRIRDFADSTGTKHQQHQRKNLLGIFSNLFVALYFLLSSSIPTVTPYTIDGVIGVTFPFTIAVIDGKVNSIPSSEVAPYLINATDAMTAASFFKANGNRMLRAASEVKWRPRLPTAVSQKPMTCPSNNDEVNVDNDSCASVTAIITIDLMGDVHLAKRVSDSFTKALNELLNDSDDDWFGGLLRNSDILLLSHGDASVASSTSSFASPAFYLSVIGGCELFVFGLLGICMAIHRVRH